MSNLDQRTLWYVAVLHEVAEQLGNQSVICSIVSINLLGILYVCVGFPPDCLLVEYTALMHSVLSSHYDGTDCIYIVFSTIIPKFTKAN